MKSIITSAVIEITNCSDIDATLYLLIAMCLFFLASMLVATYLKYEKKKYKKLYLNLLNRLNEK